MVEKSSGIFQSNAPTIKEARTFLRQHFTGIPSDALSEVMRDRSLWPAVPPGPRKKQKTDE